MLPSATPCAGLQLLRTLVDFVLCSRTSIQVQHRSGNREPSEAVRRNDREKAFSEVIRTKIRHPAHKRIRHVAVEFFRYYTRIIS